MSELAPDADVDGRPQHLTIRPLCTELRRRLELPDSDARVSPQALRTCLRSLAENFGSGTEKRSMLQIQGHGPRQPARRPASPVVADPDHLRAASRDGAGGAGHGCWPICRPATRESSLIVECKARDLLDAIDADLDLKTTLRDPATALEHALLYMHDNRVLELDKGRSVFRSAMTIQTDPAAGQAPLQQGRFRAAARTSTASARCRRT